MKIALITLHRVGNYGSVLQTYATQRILENMGHDVEVVDYYPERLRMLGMLKRIKYKVKGGFLIYIICRIIILPSYLKRFHVFKAFVNKHLNLTIKTYKTAKELEEYPPIADIYCTGSDQVWNSEWNEKIEHPYFLHFAPPEKKCIAYAASFGKNMLNDWEKEETRQLLQKYSFISMRENSGINILEDLGISNAVQVLDPTLMITKEEWTQLIHSKYRFKNYVLVYNINRNKKLDDYAWGFAAYKNLKLIYISYNYHDFYKRGKLICCPKVGDFLALIANAQYVLTDSFHATAFSINFNKQVLIFYPERFSTRLASIVEIAGLDDHVVKNHNDFTIADKKIDTNRINKVLEEHRNKSREFLEYALQAIK